MRRREKRVHGNKRAKIEGRREQVRREKRGEKGREETL